MGRVGLGGVGDEHHGKEEKGRSSTKIRLHTDRMAQAHFSMLFLSLSLWLRRGGTHLS